MPIYYNFRKTNDKRSRIATEAEHAKRLLVASDRFEPVIELELEEPVLELQLEGETEELAKDEREELAEEERGEPVVNCRDEL